MGAYSEDQDERDSKQSQCAKKPKDEMPGPPDKAVVCHTEDEGDREEKVHGAVSREEHLQWFG